MDSEPAATRVSQRRGRKAQADELVALLQAGPVARRPRSAGRATRPSQRLLRDAIDTLDGRVFALVERGAQPDFEARDPLFIGRQVRWLGPLCDSYFRGSVRHLDRIPSEGPVLCVGNHSGGLLTPDTWVLMAAYFRHFGVQRPTYALAHSLVMGLPVVGDWLRRVGALPAHPDNARAALNRGAAVLVYPGGDEDVFRSWRDRNRIHLAGRTGFVRLALQEGVPIVPIVSVGGHETALVLGDGRRLAHTLGLDRLRIKSLPLVVAPPWGVSPGDLLGHVPMPAKITVEVGKPIDFRSEFGELDARDPEVIWAAYHLVEARMQAQLDALAGERRLPIVG